jgi:hypothetical protein
MLERTTIQAVEICPDQSERTIILERISILERILILGRIKI